MAWLGGLVTYSMRILVVGGNGQLGREMRRCLTDMHSEMGAIDARYEGAHVDCVDVEDFDIADEASVRAWFIGRRPYDIVFNCAAMTNVDGCEQDEAAAIKVNALGPLNLAIAARSQDAVFVQVSTDYVFPGTDPLPQTENAKPCPISAYGRSKLAGELLAQDANPRTFIVRTAWLYGYEGKNFVKTIVRLAKSQGKVAVVVDQWGNPTSANDLAHCLLALALTDAYGIYHAVGETTCSWFDFACTALDLEGVSCEREPLTSAEYRTRFPLSAARPAYSALDSSKIAQVAGVRPRPWERALKDYIARADL